MFRRSGIETGLTEKGEGDVLMLNAVERGVRGALSIIGGSAVSIARARRGAASSTVSPQNRRGILYRRPVKSGTPDSGGPRGGEDEYGLMRL